MSCYKTPHKPLVSIVTPAYNAEKFLEETLKSVMYQDYPRIEHIVIDDGSTDATPKILYKYEKLYNLKWLSKENEGQAITLNRGFKIARGDIIVWLNADDVLFSRDVISEVVKHFLKYPEADVMNGHMAIIDEKNRLLKIQYAPHKITLDYLSISHPAACIFYKKDIVRKYPLSSKFKNALDYEQCLRMAADSVKFIRINKILIAWRKHCAAESINKRARLIGETKYLRSKYHHRISRARRLIAMFNLYSELILYKLIYGIKDILEIYTKPDNKKNLAFNLRIDSPVMLIIEQMIPYV